MTNLFKRTELANEVADKILFTSPTSASSSGLFLAAPRRTGKSTFLREDLRLSAPDLSNVQQVLVALQEKGLVWKAARGVYALEDTSLGELLLQGY